MKLSDRKRKILEAVVLENIKRAEPISSGELKDRYMQDISSATIRNELMALEEMGFLSQPHTSSGRIPTVEAFRLYANDIASVVMPTEKELNKLKQDFDKKIVDMEDFAKNTAKVISEATRYASVVRMMVGDDAVIKTIKVIKISARQALVVVVTDIGVIKDIILNTESEKDDKFFDDASNFITGIYAGKSLISLMDTALIESKVEKFKLLFDMVVDVVRSREKHTDDLLATSGVSNLLEYPEYTDSGKAKETLKIFDNKDELYPLVQNNDGLEICIKVGGDGDKLKDCSLVSAKYTLNGKDVGSACVIGPVRMDYEKVIKVLKGINENISECFKGETDE